MDCSKELVACPLVAKDLLHLIFQEFMAIYSEVLGPEILQKECLWGGSSFTRTYANMYPVIQNIVISSKKIAQRGGSQREQVIMIKRNNIIDGLIKSGTGDFDLYVNMGRNCRYPENSFSPRKIHDVCRLPLNVIYVFNVDWKDMLACFDINAVQAGMVIAPGLCPKDIIYTPAFESYVSDNQLRICGQISFHSLERILNKLEQIRRLASVLKISCMLFFLYVG